MDVPDDLELFAQMCFLRHFEERTDALYRQGLIHGPVHLGLGQEAIAVGAASVLRPGDCSLGTYRGHAHALARGAPPDAVLAELLGKTGGICGGRRAAPGSGKGEFLPRPPGAGPGRQFVRRGHGRCGRRGHRVNRAPVAGRARPMAPPLSGPN
jgi:hypothetical protein